MYRILEKETLAPNTIRMRILAPDVARKAEPGHFVILRVDEQGERFPISIAGWDREAGTIDITFGIMGRSTLKLAELNPGDELATVTGPLGNPSEIDNFGTVLCVCGHFGIGPSIALIRKLKERGNRVISVVEASSESTLFWDDRLREISDESFVVTGSHTADEFLASHLSEGNTVDKVFVLGRVFTMMRCANVTQRYGISTTVSLTPIMVDGTGMCGCCRVGIGEETKFACVHGPEFDGHHVDWELLVRRKGAYIAEEALAYGLDSVETLRTLSAIAELS